MKQTWWVADEHRTWLADRLDVAAWMQPGAQRTPLSSDRQSAAVRVDEEPRLLVKWRAPVADKVHRTLLRPSRERLEARAALRLAALGIDTPQPWAVGELRARGTLVGAVLLRPFAPAAGTARELAESDPDVLTRCAAAVGCWHAAGFRHGDCYWKNLLVAPDGAVQPIGYPKAAFERPGTRGDKARWKDLAQLAAGCTELEPAVEPFAWLAAYAEAAGVTPEVRDEVEPVFERVMARKRERLASRPTREPDGPPAPVPLSPETGADTTPRVRSLGNL